jgi:preprotein translocase subunit YajC
VNGSFGAVFPLILIVLLLVLFMAQQRARNKMATRVQELQNALTVGTEVMTTSGLYGTITAMDDESLRLEIAPGVVVRWDRRAIAEVKGSGQGIEPAVEPSAAEPAEE